MEACLPAGRFTKKQILNAQYYDAPLKFHQAINHFFQAINQKHNPALHKLLTLKFQFFDKTLHILMRREVYY